MPNKYKCVQINLEESLYDFLKKYLDLYNFNTDISYYLKCVVINRLIDLGILNELGMPNDFVFGPQLDFSALPDIGITNNFPKSSKEFADNGKTIFLGV